MADPPIGISEPPWKGSQGAQGDDLWRTAVSELEKRLIMRFDFENEARKKAELEMNRRLEGMNEFREQLREQASRFPTNNEMNSRIEAVLLKIDTTFREVMGKMESLESHREERWQQNSMRINVLDKAKANLEGRMWAIGVGFTILTIALKFIIK